MSALRVLQNQKPTRNRPLTFSQNYSNGTATDRPILSQEGLHVNCGHPVHCSWGLVLTTEWLPCAGSPARASALAACAPTAHATDTRTSEAARSSCGTGNAPGVIERRQDYPPTT